jgi:predicted RND superfamily exporter protein
MISKVSDFDKNSGTFVERILFNNRPIILLLCAIMTVFCAFQATHVKLNASFTKMIPTHQPFIVNYLNHYEYLQSAGNAIRIVVQSDRGSIRDAHYLDVLKHISDQVYLLPNVDRPYMQSLWTPSTRWTAVTGDGIASGPVIDGNYDGSAKQLGIVSENIAMSGEIGQLVSNDFTSSTIYVPLLDFDGLTNQPINYAQLANELNRIRESYRTQGVTLHIVGFGMVVGDMINALKGIILFFAISVAIAVVVLFWFTRCVRSTLLVVFASIIAVIWQLGIVPLLGYQLTPYSMLVPFLIFAIGMSHGAQKMNGVMQDIGRGAPPLVAARFTFRRLFLAGFAALTCDAASFAVLMTIRIDAIRELALLASIGVGILIFTNLIMLPILLSYTGVSKSAAVRSLRDQDGTALGRVDHPVWNFLDKFTTRRYAVAAIGVSIVLAGVGLYIGQHVQIGDLNQGAPELREHSVYNQDNAYIERHYSSGSDTLVVMVDTVPGGCLDYSTISTMNKLEWQLDQLPEVKSTSSLASYIANMTALATEGSSKWYGILWNQGFINNLWNYVPRSLSDLNCDFNPLSVSLSDHKASTLTNVVGTVQSFINNKANQSPDFKISLAGGNAGIEAATNIVIARANTIMLVLVYGTVLIFSFIVFRSWRAVLCAVLPLVLTSILAQALMVVLGIGIKVATLPVIALGVGIGVDYALYVLGIVIKHLREGATLSQAYHRALLFTGKVVLLTGFTLAAAVVTWVFAAIKFQADMGLLLSFMFLWNMAGAMILLPSLAYFLLPPRLFVKKEEVKDALVEV